MNINNLAINATLSMLLFSNYGYTFEEFSMEEQIQFIEKLEDVLNDSTLDTGVIEKTVGQLKNNVKQDKYLGYEQVEYFAKKIQSDLQEYTDSKNLIINHEQATHLDTELSDDNPINFNIVNGDIGFLTVNAFSSTKEIDLALDKINEIDTLIIDLRTNKGGKESVSRYLASYFFDQKTLLRRVIYKDKQNNTDVWTNPNKNNISKPLLPIYILVDKATSGLAERFTMSMKAYDKAYIVGEPTLGEISFIKSYPLLKGVSIELPVASIAGPKGETWPESGIEPDLSVVSVLAFREAQSMAQYSAMEYRVKTGRGTANEEYTVNKGEIDYGDWVLYNGSCLLKYKFAKPLFNKNKKTYSFPFQLMYYGINPTSMTYRLGNNDKTIKQTVNFTSRSDIKKGLAIGFKNPENFRVISCEHDK